MRYENTNTPLPAMKKKEPETGTIPYSKTDFTTPVYGIAVKSTYPSPQPGHDIYFTDTPNTGGSSVTPRFSLTYAGGVVSDWQWENHSIRNCDTRIICGEEYYISAFCNYQSENQPVYQRINPTGYQGTSLTYIEENVRFFTEPVY